MEAVAVAVVYVFPTGEEWSRPIDRAWDVHDALEQRWRRSITIPGTVVPFPYGKGTHQTGIIPVW